MPLPHAAWQDRPLCKQSPRQSLNWPLLFLALFRRAKPIFELIVEPHGHSPWHPSSRPSGATSPDECRDAFIHGQSPWLSAAGVNQVSVSLITLLTKILPRNSHRSFESPIRNIFGFLKRSIINESFSFTFCLYSSFLNIL